MTSDDDKPLTPEQARQKLQKGLSDYLAGNDPGTIVFRLKRTKKASETYPLKLTQQQRETLLNYTQLSRTLENKIKQAGEAGPPHQNRRTGMNGESGIRREPELLRHMFASFHDVCGHFSHRQ